jgi:hypothetical protein
LPQVRHHNSIGKGHERLGHHRNEATGEVEDQVAKMPKRILDVASMGDRAGIERSMEDRRPKVRQSTGRFGRIGEIVEGLRMGGTPPANPPIRRDRGVWRLRE